MLLKNPHAPYMSGAQITASSFSAINIKIWHMTCTAQDRYGSSV